MFVENIEFEILVEMSFLEFPDLTKSVFKKMSVYAVGEKTSLLGSFQPNLQHTNISTWSM